MSTSNLLEVSISYCSYVVLITIAKLHSTKPELSFCASSHPAYSELEICNGGNLWRWSQFEITSKASLRSAIPLKHSLSSSSSSSSSS